MTERGKVLEDDIYLSAIRRTNAQPQCPTVRGVEEQAARAGD